jgi:two-component system KDP operon response regulator KdpE
MPIQTILLIDDDPILQELLTEHLRAVGYRPLSAVTGQEGLHLMAQMSPDLIVLDVMMPGLDGWELCRQIRAHSSIPIIMLTAKSEEIDKLHGFRLGVDDYVAKPFSFAELTARIGAVLSRTSRFPAQVAAMSRGNLTIDFDQRRVTVDGRIVELTRTEFRLLEALARHAGQTVPTEHLIDAVWGPTYIGEVEQVKHFIWTLRKKIETDPGDPKHLITERGFGYRLE